MTNHVRVLSLPVCLSILIGFAAAATDAAEIRRQAPCASNLTGNCLQFGAEGEIPVVRSLRFNAPNAGTAAVSFHGSLVCAGSTVSEVEPADMTVDLATQIVAAADAVPTVNGPGGLRLLTVLKNSPEHSEASAATFNLASTRVFRFPAAGTQTYRFKIARLRSMDPDTACAVYNAAFTVIFLP